MANVHRVSDRQGSGRDSTSRPCSVAAASSYRPAQAVCAARSVYRYRQNLVSQSAQQVQHIQGALDQMNLKLHFVLDDLTGLTGQAILAAIVAGERD